MSPLSRDPSKRAAQLANLNPGRGAAGARNQRAVSHGAYARIVAAELEAKTREIFDALSADAPLREADGGLPAADVLVVRMLAEVMVRRERVRLEELRHGFEAPDGKLRGVVEYGLRLDAQALEIAKEMGMTPLARSKLGLDTARTKQILKHELAEELARIASERDVDVVDATAEEEES